MNFQHMALLAIAGFSYGALDTFFEPRFCVTVPRSLVDHLFPWLVGLEEAVKSLGKDARPSHIAMPALVLYLGSVVVQDALELAAKYPSNPVHALLLKSADFRCAPALPRFQSRQYGMIAIFHCVTTQWACHAQMQQH